MLRPRFVAGIFASPRLRIGLVVLLWSAWMGGHDADAQTRSRYRAVTPLGFGGAHALGGSSIGWGPGHATPIPIFGFGYAYDPYITGSFRAPDLHDDPLFRYQNRYNSHFPGRRSRREALRREDLPPVPYNPHRQSYGFPIGR